MKKKKKNLLVSYRPNDSLSENTQFYKSTEERYKKNNSKTCLQMPTTSHLCHKLQKYSDYLKYQILLIKNVKYLSNIQNATHIEYKTTITRVKHDTKCSYELVYNLK